MIKFDEALNLKPGDTVYNYYRGKVISGTIKEIVTVYRGPRRLSFIWQAGKKKTEYFELVGDDCYDMFLTEAGAKEAMRYDLNTQIKAMEADIARLKEKLVEIKY